MEPKLGVIEEVACGQRDTLWLRHVADVEVASASVKPWERVVGAIVLQKLKLVHRGHDLVARVIINISMPTTARMLW
jgi:hypothetical protein